MTKVLMVLAGLFTVSMMAPALSAGGRSHKVGKRSARAAPRSPRPARRRRA